MSEYRLIPSIEQLRQRAALRALEARYGREAIVEALREEATLLRQRLAEGRNEMPAPVAGSAPATASGDGRERAARGDPQNAEEATVTIERAVEARLRRDYEPSLRPVINATGVIIHTNLGRAPLSAAAARRVAEIAQGYSNIEYDLGEGTRGSRDRHAERLLCRLTGGEAAVVVNNNAAAVLLALAALADGRDVLIARGELVEIGGGFRVPDVMAQSGAVLREVGTTNKTRAADYSAAIGERTGLILRVHASNFRIVGFTERPAVEELVALGRRFAIPVVEDQGSGNVRRERADAPAPNAQPRVDSEASASFSATSTVVDALRDEPAVRASLDAGVDLVCFSGDKLLGGPQCGVIVGKRTLVERIRKHPLMRALRVDKMTYAALEATLIEHVAGRARATIPVARMIACSAEAVGARAVALASRLGAQARLRTEIVDGFSTIGGGSAPGAALPTRLLALSATGLGADGLSAHLRRLDPPVIARIENDRLVLDLRTVLPEQDELLAQALLRL